MSSRHLFASILVASLLAGGFLDIASVANAGAAKPAFLDRGKHLRNHLNQIKYRARNPRIYLPIAPSYRYYDYPYYYSRGYYPTHIGPGFIYYGYPYSYYTSRYHRGYARPCSYWHGKCAAKRGESGLLRRGPRRSVGACRCP
jgi:hypothetical protein